MKKDYSKFFKRRLILGYISFFGFFISIPLMAISYNFLIEKFSVFILILFAPFLLVYVIIWLICTFIYQFEDCPKCGERFLWVFLWNSGKYFDFKVFMG